MIISLANLMKLVRFKEALFSVLMIYKDVFET